MCVCTSSSRVTRTRRPCYRLLGSCLLPDLARGLLQAEVALLVCPAGAEASAHNGRPRPALEQEDREDDAEAEAEGGLDQEVGEAAVPLFGVRRVSPGELVSFVFLLLLPGIARSAGICADGLALEQWLTFSFKSASLTGRATVLGGGGGTDVWAILNVVLSGRSVS